MYYSSVQCDISSKAILRLSLNSKITLQENRDHVLRALIYASNGKSDVRGRLINPNDTSIFSSRSSR